MSLPLESSKLDLIDETKSDINVKVNSEQNAAHRPKKSLTKNLTVSIHSQRT
jgi:hypothetical protein